MNRSSVIDQDGVLGRGGSCWSTSPTVRATIRWFRRCRRLAAELRRMTGLRAVMREAKARRRHLVWWWEESKSGASRLLHELAGGGHKRSQSVGQSYDGGVGQILASLELDISLCGFVSGRMVRKVQAELLCGNRRAEEGEPLNEDRR